MPQNNIITTPTTPSYLPNFSNQHPLQTITQNYRIALSVKQRMYQNNIMQRRPISDITVQPQNIDDTYD